MGAASPGPVGTPETGVPARSVQSGLLCTSPHNSLLHVQSLACTLIPHVFLDSHPCTRDPNMHTDTRTPVFICTSPRIRAHVFPSQPTPPHAYKAPVGWGGAGGKLVIRAPPVGPHCLSSPGTWTDELWSRPPWAAVHEKASLEPSASMVPSHLCEFQTGQSLPPVTREAPLT